AHAERAGFFILRQSGERPEREAESFRFDTMHASAILQAWAKTVGPSPSMCSLNRMPGRALATIDASVALPFDGARAETADTDTYRQLSLFGDVFERLRADYVEKPDDSKLIESAINGMLAGLDPHSSYMDSKSFRDLQVQTRGEFVGLGIEVTMEDGLIKVVAPIEETPAAKAGIMANDI